VRSFWPAWASALLAILAPGASSAHSSGVAALPLPAGPSFVRADGNLAAAAVPGNRQIRLGS
jgi:hypothetical protein